MPPPGHPRWIAFTGFGAFPGVPDNPSAALVEALRASGEPAFADCTFEVLDVTYAAVGPALDRILAERPRALVMTGFSRRASALQLESAATDRRAAGQPDAAGFAPSNAAARAVTRLACPHIDFAGLAPRLASAGIPTGISHDAGEYVCNHTLYTALERLAGTGTPALFVHIPAIAGTLLARESVAAQPLAVLVQAMALIAGHLMKDEDNPLCINDMKP